MHPSIDVDAAIQRLMRFLAVEGVTGQEKAISREIQAALKEVGVASKFIKYDTAHERIPLPTQTGNLIVTLPGTIRAPRLLFMTHMDTVPLCAGAVPVRKGNKIVPEARTALGGDNRTGCAALVTLIAELMRQKCDYPPLTLLFTVREESGLFGARHLEPADLSGPVMGFNIDGGLAADLNIGATGAERWEVEVRGKASHAGVFPERGISATIVVAKALSQVYSEGMFGKVQVGDKRGTSNVGSISGPNGGSCGEATNVVTDYAHVTGESRSQDMKFCKEITDSFKAAFKSAAETTVDHEGTPAKVKFTSRIDYYPFRLADDSPVVQKAITGVKAIGREAKLKVTNGGLDANWIVKHGIPTVTFGAGQNEIHTVKEFVDIKEFLAGCELAFALAKE